MKKVLKSIWSFLKKEWNDEIRIIVESWNLRKIKRKKERSLKRIAKSKIEAIKMANLRHNADNRTYYVLKNHKGEHVALNKDEIKRLKKRGYIRKSFDFAKLAEHSPYMKHGKS